MTQRQSLWLIYLLSLVFLPVPFFLIFEIALFPILYLTLGFFIPLFQEWRIPGTGLWFLIHCILWMVALYFISKLLTRLMFLPSKVVGNVLACLAALVILALSLIPVYDGGPVPPPKVSALTLYERIF